ncbi:MAG: alkaline phosphatase family protein [Gallionella sp.]
MKLNSFATLLVLSASLFANIACAAALPRPDHVVIVIEENRGYSQIMDKRNSDSYIHALANRGALMVQSFGVAHPSQPNYLALFSGSTQGVRRNSCPHRFNGDNLASSLMDAGLSFASYSESLPAEGNLSCSSGDYKRKHNPLANWQETGHLPASTNLRFADFPQDFPELPTVSFVIPDQANDMHDGGFQEADAWLKKNIDPYVEWAYKHNSLLILTWDEDNYRENNHIYTAFIGPMVKPGISMQRVNHYSVLRTLMDFYGLPPIGESLSAEPITGIWK